MRLARRVCLVPGCRPGLAAVRLAGRRVASPRRRRLMKQHSPSQVPDAAEKLSLDRDNQAKRLLDSASDPAPPFWKPGYGLPKLARGRDIAPGSREASGTGTADFYARASFPFPASKLTPPYRVASHVRSVRAREGCSSPPTDRCGAARSARSPDCCQTRARE